MSFRRRLLEYVVDAYDREERPVTADDAAAALEADRRRVETCLMAFAESHLLARESPGYRPTVTAREFLELDLDGGVVVPDSSQSGED